MYPTQNLETSYFQIEEHRIYFETSGNPKGVPVLYLHGGPGGVLSAGYRKYFDPDFYYIIGLQQRGSGQSTPHAIDHLSQLADYNTQNFIQDIEFLRKLLKIEKWVVYGTSWGTTLALHYSVTCTQSVIGLILGVVGVTNEFEVNWITRQMGNIFPQEWAKLKAAFEVTQDDLAVQRFYQKYVQAHLDQKKILANAWCDWEDTHISLVPGYEPYFHRAELDFKLNFTLLVLHFWSHFAFASNDLLSQVRCLSAVPVYMIHGRYDISSPLMTAFTIQQQLPQSELVIVNEGHGSPLTSQAVLDASEKMKKTHCF